MEGRLSEKPEPVRSNVPIALPLMVCKHNLAREQVATNPCQDSTLGAAIQVN